MADTGGESAAARRSGRQSLDGPLFALWLLLPACVWWIGFGPAWIHDHAAAWGRRPVYLVLGFWLLWMIGSAGAALARRNAPLARPLDRNAPLAPLANPLDPLSLPAALGTILYLFTGAGFLFVLGPGIAPVRQPIARGMIAAGMIACAWIGWTLLFPGSRRLALRLLRSIRGAR